LRFSSVGLINLRPLFLVMPSATGPSYSAASLFSGCGGFCEGAKLAGFRILAAVENDRYAAETYRHNFPDVPLFEETVAAFRSPGDPRWEQEKARFAALDSNDVDLVFGGPPCQGYSQIGPRDLSDPRNVLYGEFVRVLRDLRPRAFLMENVPNMLMLGKGTFADQALGALRDAGYANADVRVLPATDFGVPQLRKRAVFFGTRDDLNLPLPAGEWIEIVARLERQPETTVGQAIGDLPRQVSRDDGPLSYPRLRAVNPIRSELRLDTDGRYYSSKEKLARAGGELRLFNHHTKEIQERRQQLIAQLKPGAKGDSLPPEVWNGLRPEKWRRLHPNRPAYTILAQMHRDLSEWVHPRHERWITVREAARLQSFHDGFVFKTSEWQMLKQIGNAVPPLLGRAAGMIARRALESCDGEWEIPEEAGVPGELQLAA
jgi:DNA (cytosine-5)-methyltransferase 1